MKIEDIENVTCERHYSQIFCYYCNKGLIDYPYLSSEPIISVFKRKYWIMIELPPNYHDVLHPFCSGKCIDEYILRLKKES